MPINPGQLKAASIKAKKVATEEYVEKNRFTDTTIVSGGQIQTGVISMNQLTQYNVPSNYTGTIADIRGIRVYENGICKVKLGNLV